MKIQLVLAALALVQAVSAQEFICKLCGCSFCPDTFKVGSPDGEILIPAELQEEVGHTSISCSILDLAGKNGLIPENLCGDELRLLPEIRQVCGCPALPPKPTPVYPESTPASANVKTTSGSTLACDKSWFAAGLTLFIASLLACRA